ncbi:MAG TPA: hypothetical protein VGR05_00490 [Sphingomicrobium sp.]|nr:hypothetical protein [Sphingomicrobium sp.]
MSIESNKRGEGKNPMERQLIQLDKLPDQAGIAAALRRAFAERLVPVGCDTDDSFAALLRRIH